MLMGLLLIVGNTYFKYLGSSTEGSLYLTHFPPTPAIRPSLNQGHIREDR